MKPNFAEQIERMVKDFQAVMAKVNANSKAIKASVDALVKTKPRQSEQAQGLLERPMSPLPKEEPRDDDADCEAAVTLIRKTRQASISHFQLSLGWGYNRASRILGLLQKRGIVGEKIGEMSYEILALPKSPVKKSKCDAKKSASKKKSLRRS